MLSYKLTYESKILPINKTKKYSSKALKELKNNLNNTKSQLDKYFTNTIFPRYWREFDPFRQEKNIVARLGNTINVSNAWLKCYEILNMFNLIPHTLEHKEFIHFDNAAFPGSFIVSIHHYIKTYRDWHSKYKWYGSSLIESNDLNAKPIEDKYMLYQNYPLQWLMDKNNNGDVLLEENQKIFHSILGGKVDLYTSDLGFDVSSDYNNQEIIQAPANIGQIISGLITLRKGGNFITKQYMTFEMITISIMFAVSSFFDEFYLCKPETSREANSETYLVGKGFKEEISFDHPYIQAMVDRITGKVPLIIPLFDANDYPTQYLKDIVKASDEIFNRQIKKINIDIKKTHDCINERFHGKSNKHPIVIKFRNQVEPAIESWYKKMKILPMKFNHKLIMKDTLYQS
jgi:hypothetical protein